MMPSQKVILGTLVSAFFVSSTAAQECSTSWVCQPISVIGGNTPILDADHSEWENVVPFTTNLVGSLTGDEYDASPEQVTLKCLHDDEHIYFAFEFPGEYRFDASSNPLCAAIGVMFKMGAKATYLNMGGCPEALGGCADGVPETCDEYRVDIGAHWELSGTEQSTLYDVSDSVLAADKQGSNGTTIPGTGNDLIANKDDEYSVSPYCRFDDDDSNADNEWAGAWAHTASVDGEFGMYHFEMSRKLKTASTLTDAQLTPGETIQFGVAFWDPNETDEGWTAAGHFVTGCGNKWIDLELGLTQDASVTGEEEDDDSTSGSESVNKDSSSSSGGGTSDEPSASVSGAATFGSRPWLVAVQAAIALFWAIR